MKKNCLLMVVVLAAVSILFIGCSKDEDGENSMLVGTWKSWYKNNVADITHTYTFNSNGTYTWKQSGSHKPYSSSPWVNLNDEEKGTYAYDSASKTISFSGTEYNGSTYSRTYICYVQSLTNTTLVLVRDYQDGPDSETFTKQ